MAKKEMTPDQRERQRPEHRSQGRYAKTNACELCHKSAGVDYYSDRRQSGALGVFGLVLCKRCAAELDDMPDDEALAALEAANDLRLEKGV